MDGRKRSKYLSLGLDFHTLLDRRDLLGDVGKWPSSLARICSLSLFVSQFHDV